LVASARHNGLLNSQVKNTKLYWGCAMIEMYYALNIVCPYESIENMNDAFVGNEKDSK